MIWTEEDKVAGKVRVMMVNGLGKQCPLLDETGREVNIRLDILSLKTNHETSQFVDRLARADEAFALWHVERQKPTHPDIEAKRREA